MSWFKFWPQLFGSNGTNTSGSSSDAVHEELMFHFRELVNEKIAEGQTFELAWSQAENQFGSLRRYEGECHAMQSERRLIWRIAGAVIVGVVLLSACLSIIAVSGVRLKNSLHRMHYDLAALRSECDTESLTNEATVSKLLEEIRRSGAKPPPNDAADLTGRVVDEEKNPLSEATVLVILKTWPGGRYLQEDFTATTNTEGQFCLPEIVPSEGQYAIQVAALKEGFAFKSSYQLFQTQRPDPLLPVTLQLQPATALTLVVRNEKGEPIPNAHVTPFSRKSKQGENHLIYFQGSESVHRTTDAEGRVQLSCFLAGDNAEICLQLPGNDWDQRAFEVSDREMIVEVALSNTNIE